MDQDIQLVDHRPTETQLPSVSPIPEPNQTVPKAKATKKRTKTGRGSKSGIHHRVSGDSENEIKELDATKKKSAALLTPVMVKKDHSLKKIKKSPLNTYNITRAMARVQTQTSSTLDACEEHSNFLAVLLIDYIRLPKYCLKMLLHWHR